MKRGEVALIGIAAGALALLIARRSGFDIGSIASGAADYVMEAIGMRGIRNNNPGNIRHSGARWQGMSAQQTDPAFVQFEAPEYGIRALSKLLDTYATKYNLNTVRNIIARYAPSSENNTAAYASAVAGALGVSPDAVIDVQARKAELVQAIIKHENGAQPYSLAQINTGVTMA